MSAAYWISNLAAWSAQMTALVAVAAAAVWAFRFDQPHIRLAFWQGLLAICLLLPAVEPWREAPRSNVTIATGNVAPVPPRRKAHDLPPWREGLLIILAAGCAGRALWLAIGLAKLRRRRRDAYAPQALAAALEELRTAIAPQAAVQLSPSVAGPVTFGLWRPVVVLPRKFAELSAEAQQAILCHELVHVRRRDWTMTVAEQAIRAVLWFHPAVWWVIGQIQLTREQTVDGEVVALTRNRDEYLKALLAMAGNRLPLDLAAAPSFLKRRHLKKRVALLMKETNMSKRKVASFCATSAAVLCAAGWLALHTFPLQGAPVPQDQKESPLLHSVQPIYPQAAKEKHIEGAVAVELQIDADGHVADARVLSGPQELRNAALQAVLQWHYSASAMSLPTTTQVTLNFSLDKGGTATIARPGIEGPPFTLKGLSVEGLSASARDELLQKLPVHAGDTVDAAVMQSVVDAARAFDDHLVVVLSRIDNTIHILVSTTEPAAAGAPKRIRVGGNMQQAKLITKVRPIYPADAKAQRIQGIVKLQAILGKDGKVESLEVLSGDPLLAAAALEAVRQWQYQTTLLNGDPVEVMTEVDVNFTLAQ